MADDAATSEKGPPPETQKFDFGGDTTLVVGPQGSYRICVSKALLSIASNYFKTVFGPKFSEGGQANAGNDVKLEGDDPDACVLLFKILHMRYDSSKSPTPDELVALCAVADKYDCIQAVRLPISSFLPSFNLSALSDMDLLKLVAVAGFFDHPDAFERYTKAVIMDRFSLTPVTFSELLPATTWCEFLFLQESNGKIWLLTQHLGAIEARRSSLYKQILAVFNSLWDVPCHTEDCPFMPKWYYRLSIRLQSLGLDSSHRLKLSEVLSKVNHLELPPIAEGVECGPGNYGVHLAPMSPFALKSKLDQITKQGEGLCLDCVHTGGKRTNECRIKHF